MNLKRLRGIATVALITIAAALFAGCSNSMAGSIDESAVGNSNARMATLSLSATGIPEEYAKEFDAYCKSVERQRLASRSILPDNPFQVNDTTLILVLTGKSETGMTYGPKVVTLKPTATTGVYDFDDTDGPIAMDAMSWNLVLTAYSDAAKTKPVLRGYCSVDLRNGSNSATFVMGIAGLTTPGSVDISGTIVDTDKVAKSYTMGIYRKDNGKDVGNTEQTEASFDVTTGAAFIFTANGKDVPPGTYLYTMIFYNDVSEIIGSFTDTIVINPGNKLTKENLKIDVIGKKPTEPEDLKAYLVKDSESSDGRTYNVKVTWTQADYATNYELNVVESAGDGSDLTSAGNGTAIAGGTIYGMASMDKTTPTKIVNDFPGSAVFGTGSSSMMYGDGSCVLKLETGKVYEIQLRARNYIGVSKWVDREAGDTAEYGAYKAPDDQRINRLLITYNTDGGILKVGGTTDTYDVKYAEYKCWTIDTDLMVIKPDDGNEPTPGEFALKKGTSAFVGWLLDDGTAVKSDITVTSTRGDAVKKYTYKNVTVIASFGNEVSASISQEAAQKDILRTHLVLKYGVTGDVTQGLTADADGIYSLTKFGNDGTSNQIQIELKNTGTDYTNVKFEVWGQSNSTHKSVTQTSAGVCQIDTAFYPAGKMYVMVTADTANATSMSQTLIFDLK